MQNDHIDKAARKWGLRYSDIEREKEILVQVPTIAAGDVRQIYLPYDQDLANAIITGIRVSVYPENLPSEIIGPSGPGLTITAALASLFCLTIVNKYGVKVWDRLPLYFLIRANTINRDTDVNCCFTFKPGMSFLSYFDTSRGYSRNIIPLAFRYKSLIQS